MDISVLWLCIICMALGLFFSINNYTLRHLASSQLAAILRNHRRQRSGQWAIDDIQGLFLTTANQTDPHALMIRETRLAMGLSPRDLGFALNTVKVQGLLAKVEGVRA